MRRLLRARLHRRPRRDALLAFAAAQHATRAPDLGDAVLVDTEVGPLHVHARDEAVSPHLQAHGFWERGETQLFAERLRPGMTFLDVGAHIGYFSVLAGRLVGPGGVVLAFEPHPRNFELLLANVWLNGLTNIACFPWAVSDTSGLAELYEAPLNTGDHQLAAAGSGRPALPVRTVALDAVAAIRPPVDVVKIDVQGAEEAALRGMEGLLAASPRALVVFEYWPTGLRRFAGDPRRVLEYVRSRGYSVAVQEPDEPGVRPPEPGELDRLADTEGDAAWTNLVLTR